MKISVLYELFVVLLLGAAPASLAFIFGGVDALERSISVLLADESAINYFAGLTVIYLSVAFLDRQIWKATDASVAKWRFMRAVLEEVSAGFLGILRAGSGVLIALPFLLFVVEPAAFSRQWLGTLLVGLMGFITSFFWACVHKKSRSWGNRKPMPY